jgi:DNA replication and repair protein RecF
VRVVALEAQNLRNLEPFLLEPAPRFNVFHGDNGQGKTNLLEVVYVVAALRSFRTAKLADLIRFGAQRAHLAARVLRSDVERIYEVDIEPRGRQIRLDGKGVRPLARYFGGFNVVLFAPEDLQLPRGAPVDRRRFHDRAVFNRRADYMPLVQDYEKVVKSRNVLLREVAERRRDASLLEVYDQQLAGLAARIASVRLGYVDELRARFQGAFEAISRTGVDVDIVYRTAPEIVAADAADRTRVYHALVEAARGVDLARGVSTVGPHRDDLGFVFAGHDAGGFASQGQLRALMLAWKTAEMELLAHVHGEEPILLLDDVSSELDPHRNEYLFAFLSRRRNQCFITTTHPSFVLLDEDRVDHEVREGRIIKAL